jgi:ubiquinone/menaquinone biosynthesis C-methylase UbiE
MHGDDPTSTIARSYDAQAPGYDRRWSGYVDRSTALTLTALPALAPGARVLDVGCGTGRLLAALRARDEGLSLTGVDASEGMLAKARERLGPDVGLRRAPAEDLPFGDDAFDIVVTVSSLHHWRMPERGLAEIARVLASEGLLVVTDWCRESWSMRLMDIYLRLRDPAHHRALTRGELAGMAVGAGFRIQRHTRHPIDRLWLLQVLTAGREGVLPLERSVIASAPADPRGAPTLAGVRAMLRWRTQPLLFGEIHAPFGLGDNSSPPAFR